MSFLSTKFDYRVAIQDVCDALNALMQLKVSVESDLSDECQTPLTSPSSTTVTAAENFFNCIVLLSPYLCLSLDGSDRAYQNIIKSTDQVTDYGVCAVNQCNLGNMFIFRKEVLVDSNSTPSESSNLSLALLLDSTNTDIYDPANMQTVVEALESLINHYSLIKNQWIKNYRNKSQVPLMFLKELIDVFQTNPQDNQALVYQSGNWFNQFLTLAKSLSDVNITNPGTNTGTSGTGVDVLQYDSSGCQWINDCLELDGLCDVLITNPGTNTGTSGNGIDTLVYDTVNSRWVNNCLNFTDLCDVDTDGATTGAIIRYNGTNWVVSDETSVTLGSDFQRVLANFLDNGNVSNNPNLIWIKNYDGGTDPTDTNMGATVASFEFTNQPPATVALPNQPSTTATAFDFIKLTLTTGPTMYPTFQLETNNSSTYGVRYLVIFIGTVFTNRNNGDDVLQIAVNISDDGVYSSSNNVLETITEVLLTRKANANSDPLPTLIGLTYVTDPLPDNEFITIVWRVRNVGGNVSLGSGSLVLSAVDVSS